MFPLFSLHNLQKVNVYINKIPLEIQKGKKQSWHADRWAIKQKI